MRQTGRVLAVENYTVGSVAAADAAAGVEVLEVTDPGAYDEAGGSVRITTDTAEFVVAYESVDDVTGLMTLTGGLTAAVAADDPVAMEPRAVERTAVVALEDATGTPILAVVPHNLRLLVPEGVRGPGDAEAVLVEEYLPGTWRVADVLGLEPTLSIGSDPLIRPDGFPRVKAYRTLDFNVGTNTDRIMGFNVIEKDTDGFALGDATSASFLLPFTGQYDVRFGVRWEPNPDNARRIWGEYSNDDGVTWVDGRNLGMVDDRLPVGGSPSGQSFAPPAVRFDAGDRVRFLCRQTSGVALNVMSAHVYVSYLGPA